MAPPKWTAKLLFILYFDFGRRNEKDLERKSCLGSIQEGCGWDLNSGMTLLQKTNKPLEGSMMI